MVWQRVGQATLGTREKVKEEVPGGCTLRNTQQLIKVLFLKPRNLALALAPPSHAVAAFGEQMGAL